MKTIQKTRNSNFSHIRIMNPYIIALTLLYILQYQNAHTQRNIELTVPISVQLGLSYAQKDVDTSNVWLQGLSNAVVLNTGIGILYKKKIGLNFMGAASANTYQFNKNNGEYSISKIGFALHGNIYYRHLIKKRNYLLFGLDAGYIFQAQDRVSAIEPTFNAETFSNASVRPFIAPEIGLAFNAGKRFYASLLATYQYQFERSKIVTIQLTDPSGTMTASAIGDYLGFKIRFHYTLFGHLEPKHPILNRPSEHDEFIKRENKTVETFSTKSKNLKIQLFDNGEIDGDIISVMVNGEYVLIEHLLSKEPIQLKLRLNSGMNRIVIIAHNEGDVSPNTMACKLVSGSIRKTLTLSSSLQSSVNLEINVD